MLGQRRRRWLNIKTTLVTRLAIFGRSPIFYSVNYTECTAFHDFVNLAALFVQTAHYMYPHAAECGAKTRLFSESSHPMEIVFFRRLLILWITSYS